LFDLGQFTRDGVTSPIRILKADDVASIEEQYRQFVACQDEHPDQSVDIKPHLVSNWLDSVVRNPALIQILETILGNDIVLWESDVQLARPGDLQTVDWHQDLPLWDLSGDRMVNVLFAITPISQSCGARLMIPGSHGSLFDSRQPTPESTRIELAAGEFCVHHGNLAWATEPNHGSDDAVVFVMRYMAADMFSRTGMDSVTWIQGERKHNEFEFEPRVDNDFDYSALKAIERARSFPSGFGGSNERAM